MKAFVITGILFFTCIQNSSGQVFKNPPSLFDPTPYGFSHSSSAQENGTYIFISGQSGAENTDHKLSGDFRTQVQFALKNLITVLSSYNLKPENTLKITILVVDHSAKKLAIWGEEMHKVWSNNLPASTLIPVPKLAIDGMLIEVDAIAFKKKT
jgi:enamine deaminase RidA (YjgF/YER057c/UK114 family)